VATPAKRTYRTSPFGKAVHPWLNKADTKFNEAGVFKTGQRVPIAEAQAMMDLVQKEAERYLAEVTEGMTAKDRKAWTLYVPFEVETDDNDNPTGFVVFNYKQNATIRLKSGEEKKITIRLQDGTGADNARPIFGGSDIRVLYALRDVKMTSGKQAGVRLDFCGVQVRKYAEGGQAGGGFGAIDGCEDEDYGAGEAMPPADRSGSAAAADGDY
jgi:hypothetical protein